MVIVLLASAIIRLLPIDVVTIPMIGLFQAIKRLPKNCQIWILLSAMQMNQESLKINVGLKASLFMKLSAIVTKGS